MEIFMINKYDIEFKKKIVKKRVQKKVCKYLKEQSSMIEYKISQEAIFMKEKKEVYKVKPLTEGKKNIILFN